MRSELISIATDTLPLDAAFYLPDAEPSGGVMLFHGNPMNFYVGAPRFLATVLPPLGFACLAFNRRGHDILSIRDSRAAEGAAFQLTREGIEDNNYAARWLAEWGFYRPVVIGHSNGDRQPSRNDIHPYPGRFCVIAKAEWTSGEANPRFVVTSLSGEDAEPQRLYEEIYCARGDMENRIKSLPSRKRGSASSTCSPTAPLFRPGPGSRRRRCAPPAAAVVCLDGLCAAVRAAPHCFTADPIRHGHLRYDPPQAPQDRCARPHQRATHQIRDGLRLPRSARLRPRPRTTGQRRGGALTTEQANGHISTPPIATPPLCKPGLAEVAAFDYYYRGV
jgi:pimeloyl-ACP methyl ester carboxylesterase